MKLRERKRTKIQKMFDSEFFWRIYLPDDLWLYIGQLAVKQSLSIRRSPRFNTALERDRPLDSQEGALRIF